MTNPTNEHRERAQEIVQWIVWDNNNTPTSYCACEGIFCEHWEQQAIERIASALSSRDAEIREVLEGLQEQWVDEPPLFCWCGAPDFVHSKACFAAQVLYAKLQPGKEGNE